MTEPENEDFEDYEKCPVCEIGDVLHSEIDDETMISECPVCGWTREYLLPNA